MTEIFNLSTLCRCCHADGSFKSLKSAYKFKNVLEIYEIMLQETLGIQISKPQMEASYAICDLCIKRLRAASQFRGKVLACERKFQIYCTNEQFLENTVVDTVKTEVEYNDAEHVDHGDDPHDNIDDTIVCKDRNNSIAIKQEITIEVDIKHPIIDQEVQTKEIVVKKPDDHPPIVEEVKKKICKKNASAISKRRHSRLPRSNVIKPYLVKVQTGTEVTYSCKSCEGSYPTRNDIVEHIKSKHFSKYICPECGQEFKVEYLLERHVRKSHKIKLYKCKHCGNGFTSKAGLHTHENMHTNKKFYQCDICQKILRYKTTLKKHILMHSGESKVLCDICGWAFHQRCNLETHIKTVHLKQRNFACSICGKTYTAKKHVKSHMLLTHSENPKPYQCNYCPKIFSCPKSCKIHQLTHEDRFTCRHCGLIIDGKKKYDEHLKTHTRPYTLYNCHVCGKALGSKFTLDRHVDLHSGIKKFACEICGIKFTQKGPLKRHIQRLHDPNIKIEKEKCLLCKKMVRNIDKHMRVHDVDERKHFCDICGKSYPEQNTLNRHKNQVHFGVGFDCDICGKKYLKRKSLENHRIKVHKIKREIEESNANTNDLDLDSGKC